MPTVIMPKMGDAMEEGTLLRWLKNEGEQVAQGEPIAEIETDKVNLEIESNDAGVMSRHLVDEGATVPIGEPIAFIAAPGEKVEESTIEPAAAAEPAQAAAAPMGKAPAESAQEGPKAGVAASENHFGAPSQSQATAPQAQTSAPAQQQAPAQQVLTRGPNERVRASPLVRRLAAEHGIDLNQVNGTGPGGRIVKVDVMPLIGRPSQQPTPMAAPSAPTAQPAEAPAAQPQPQAAQAAASAPSYAPAAAAPESELRDLPRIRRTIGKRLSESWQQAPHIFLTASINMDRAMALREQINSEIAEPEAQVSVNDLILKATAMALRKFEMLNASYAGDQVRINKQIDVSFAVAFEGGLISPVIPQTDRKPLGEIARMTKELARKVREGTIRPEEFQGGTFTVSNLGMFGIESFTSIINPPQAGILSVGTITTEPVFQDGQFKPAKQMKVTIAVDHRIVDGAVAAQFLQELRRLLESPMTLLVG